MADRRRLPPGQHRARAITRATGESRLVRWTLTAIALAFLALTLALPLVLVFVEALDIGLHDLGPSRPHHVQGFRPLRRPNQAREPSCVA